MEDHSKFDLKNRLQVWRETFSRTSGLREENLEELELHLCDSFEALKKRGLADDEAFLIALRRLGHATELDREFAKCEGVPEWQSRAFWMIVGCFIYVGGMNLATIACYLTLWVGGQAGVDGFRLGYFTLAARGVALGMVGWFGLGVLTRWNRPGSTGPGRVRARPFLFVGSLVLVVLGLQIAAILVPDQVIFRTPVRAMSGFLAVNLFAGPAAIVVILFLLIFSAAKFGAARRNASNGRPALVPLIALVGLLAAGCDRGQQTQSASTQPVTAASSSSANQTQFEKCLSSWSAGNLDAAIQAALDMDVRDSKLFSPGSALALSEAQFIALPEAARERLREPMMADLASIKGLCRRLQEEGRDAKARGDAAKATKCFSQIKLLGEQLDQPSVVLIGQLVGKALKKLAAQE